MKGSRRLLERARGGAFGGRAGGKCFPTWGGGGFLAYQQVVPGTFFSVGARYEQDSIAYPHHHPRFAIDEDALENGVRMFVQAALGLLEADGSLRPGSKE